MDQPVELIPLVCPKCNTQVPAETDEVAWVCAQCGQGLLLDEEKGLAPIEVYFAAGIPPGAKGKPFWVADGQVTTRRQAYTGNQDSEAQIFWSQPRRFFIPAFAGTLDDRLNLAMSLMVHPPALQTGTSALFEAVIMHLEDVTAAAEFVVMAIEASRKDKLKELDFSLELSTPVLWILP
jgi:hypothetical protein